MIGNKSLCKCANCGSKELHDTNIIECQGYWICRNCTRGYNLADSKVYGYVVAFISPAATPEPPPTQGRHKVLDYVLEDFRNTHLSSDPETTDNIVQDLRDRAEMGKAKYGIYLHTEDGRNTLLDLYQELLDATMYAKKYLLEQSDLDNGMFRFIYYDISNRVFDVKRLLDAKSME